LTNLPVIALLPRLVAAIWISNLGYCFEYETTL
jgi:hypothetical protein